MRKFTSIRSVALFEKIQGVPFTIFRKETDVALEHCIYVGKAKMCFRNGNIVLRDRREGGYGFCKPAGDISSQGSEAPEG